MQCSNARLLSSGGFGHLNDLNFNNSVFIAQLKACSRVPGVNNNNNNNNNNNLLLIERYLQLQINSALHLMSLNIKV